VIDDNGSMSITFKLYATLQDLLPPGTKRNATRIEVASDTSLNDIIDAYRVPRELAHLVLVNGVFVCDTDRDARNALKPDDVLAIADLHRTGTSSPNCTSRIAVLRGLVYISGRYRGRTTGVQGPF